MRIDIVRASELGAGCGGEMERWEAIRRRDPSLRSPYFSPRFAREVGRVRRDAFVGILHENGTPRGFFGFQRGRWGAGRPLAGPLSDYQGVVAEPGAAWDAMTLVRGCRLRALAFDHQLACQRQFAPYHAVLEASPLIDVSAGFGAYAAALRARGSEGLRTVERKRRKLEREVGPVRFVAATRDRGVVERTFAWKSEQYRRTGTVDVFSFGWTRELVERLVLGEGAAGNDPEGGFAGRASALYAGDRLAAAHLGMVSPTTWHYWFPAYDRALGAYSPGLLLLMELARRAAEEGMREVDLGRGASRYKGQFGNAEVPLAAGRVELPSLSSSVARWRREAEAWAERSAVAVVLRAPGRMIRRAERLRRFN